MSLVSSNGWSRQEQIRQDCAKDLGDAIQSPKAFNFRRVFIFSFPIYNKIARMDRERQLFQATMDEHIRHEHRRNPWISRVVLVFLILISLWIIVFHPPALIENHSGYKHILKTKERVLAQSRFWWGSIREHSRIPEKVWVGGLSQFPDFLRKWNLIRGIASDYDEKEAVKGMVYQIGEIQKIVRESISRQGRAKGYSVVLVVRGSVKDENGRFLAPKDLLADGSTVTTAQNSFVKLWFSDESQMSIGPGSTVKISSQRAGELSVVDLIAGTLRGKVTKSLERNQDGSVKEKFLMKTKFTSIGIRGTDFYVAYNPEKDSTYLLTFEGRVAFAKLSNSSEDYLEKLKDSSAVQEVGPGMYSEASREKPAVSVPIIVGGAQIEAIKAAMEIQGTKEMETQAESLNAARVHAREWLVGAQENRNSAEYQGLPPELGEALQKIEAEAEVGRNRATKEDYLLVQQIPPELASDHREFPDFP